MYSHHVTQDESKNASNLVEGPSTATGPKTEDLKQSEEDFETDTTASKSETNHKHFENYECEPRNLSRNTNFCQESQLKNVAKEKRDQSTQYPLEQNQTDTNGDEQSFKVDQKGLQDQKICVEEQKGGGILENEQQDEMECPGEQMDANKYKRELQETQDKLEESRKELIEHQNKSQQELESCKDKHKMEILEYQKQLKKCHEEYVTMCTCVFHVH